MPPVLAPAGQLAGEDITPASAGLAVLPFFSLARHKELGLLIPTKARMCFSMAPAVLQPIIILLALRLAPPRRYFPQVFLPAQPIRWTIGLHFQRPGS